MDKFGYCEVVYLFKLYSEFLLTQHVDSNTNHLFESHVFPVNTTASQDRTSSSSHFKAVWLMLSTAFYEALSSRLEWKGLWKI